MIEELTGKKIQSNFIQISSTLMTVKKKCSSVCLSVLHRHLRFRKVETHGEVVRHAGLAENSSSQFQAWEPVKYGTFRFRTYTVLILLYFVGAQGHHIVSIKVLSPHL